MTSPQPPRARILSTGSEILQGLYADTNAQGLSQLLFEAGFRVVGHAAAPDDRRLIELMIRQALADADVVVMTGGLGPTEDDVNREVVAGIHGVGMRHDAEAERMMRDRFAARGVPMPERNRVQAMIPEGAATLQNHWGTAPGFCMPSRNGLAALVALPGPPSEWRPMIAAALQPGAPMDSLFPVRPRLALHTLMVAMTPESVLNEALADLFAPDEGVELTILAAKGVIRLRLSGPAGSPEIQRRRDEIVRRIGPEIIVHEGPVAQSAAEAVVGLFAERGWTVATAESCTGGGIAQAITEVSGSSAVLQAGWVTYSNDSKTRDLGVPAEWIARHGAVSHEVALAMAEQARRIAGTSHAVSVTGIAGPTGGSEEKPVGTVWLAVASDAGSQAIRRQFRGRRDEVRQWAVNHGIEILRRHALGIDLNLYLGGPQPRYITG